MCETVYELAKCRSWADRTVDPHRRIPVLLWAAVRRALEVEKQQDAVSRARSHPSLDDLAREAAAKTARERTALSTVDKNLTPHARWTTPGTNGCSSSGPPRKSSRRRGGCARCCSGPAPRRPQSPRRAEQMPLLGSRPRRRRSRPCSRRPTASCTPEPSRPRLVATPKSPTASGPRGRPVG
jgi:hypothetical protein